MPEPLTPRQAQVAQLLAAGHTVKRIAAELGCSPRTVEQHVRNGAERLPGPGRPQYRMLRAGLFERLAERRD